MKRLTKKNEFGDYVGSNLLDDECLCRGLSFDEMNEMTECFNKLGNLEDAEEKLGTDFLILAKAKMDGIYRKMADGIEFYPRYVLSVYIDHIMVNTSGKQLFLSEYGKTWALTKEELK